MHLLDGFKKTIQYVTDKYTFFRLIFLGFCDFSITFSSIIASIFIYTRVRYIEYSWSTIFSIIFITFSIKFLLFVIFKIYNISFQHASVLYIIKIATVSFISAMASFFVLKAFFPHYWMVALLTLYFLFDIIGSAGFRFLPLIYHEIYNRLGEKGKDCFIYGCGETGTGLAATLIKNDIKVRGFIDDDRNKLYKVINGIQVLGDLAGLEKLLTKIKIDVLIIAIPSLSGDRIKEIKKTCSAFNIEVKIIPSFYQIYKSSRAELAASLRHVNYEDLLKRPVRKENFSELAGFFKGKKVIVTGIGSIGKEIVHHLLNFDLEKIVILDNSELNLFNMGNTIDQKAALKPVSYLIDLKNKILLEKIFAQHKPDIVFHTAAYKHVPIVEQNACEGVLNNLLCLKNTYDAAKKSGAGHFVFISSDKAVRPTNIMGATKRLGEMYIQSKRNSDAMISFSVRFGNVIGSSGSFIPDVINRIIENSPIYITHPEASRFFMLTSEAVALILKAATVSKGGEVFILDMGRAIKIVDMVKDIVAFYGKRPDVDIQIKYMGLRPGEKIFEELIFDEVENKSYKDGMYVTEPNFFDHNKFIETYDKIICYASNGDSDNMLETIKEYVRIYSNEYFSGKVE